MRKKAFRVEAYERIVARYVDQGMSLPLANRRAFTVLGPWVGRRTRELWPPLDPTCARCGSDDRLRLDYIISDRHGGWDAPANLQTLCARCDRAKGANDTDYRTDEAVSSLDTHAARRFS